MNHEQEEQKPQEAQCPEPQERRRYTLAELLAASDYSQPSSAEERDGSMRRLSGGSFCSPVGALCSCYIIPAFPLPSFDYLKDFQRAYMAKHGIHINNNQALAIILGEHREITGFSGVPREQQTRD